VRAICVGREEELLCDLPNRQVGGQELENRELGPARSRHDLARVCARFRFVGLVLDLVEKRRDRLVCNGVQLGDETGVPLLDRA
jgi:hypothetical protein